MNTSNRGLDLVAAAGLAVGAVFGMAGTLVADEVLRRSLWGIDGVGLVVATALLTVRHLRRGEDALAAGFLVFALGETLILGSAAMSLEAGMGLFAGGVALWSAGLLLDSVPRGLAAWNRIAGILAAALFALVAFRIFGGERLLPTSRPLPFFAYPFLVLTLVGWILSLLASGRSAKPRG